MEEAVTYHVPDGPARQMYDFIAAGGREDAEQLANVPKFLHATVRADRKRIHALKAHGENGPARELARECAAHLMQSIPDEWEPATPASTDPVDESPRDLARRVRRY